MRISTCVLVAFLGVFSLPVVADDLDDFNVILKEHWSRAEQEQIFFRTDPDAYRPSGKLAEVSDAARQRRRTFNEEILLRLDSINPDNLQGQNRISFKLFRYERETERQSYQNWDHLFPITKLFGYDSYFANAPANMSFASIEDYRSYLVSLEDFPRYNKEQL